MSDSGYSPHECVAAYPPGMSHRRAVLGLGPAVVHRRAPPRLSSPFGCGAERVYAERTTGEAGAIPLSCASPFCWSCDRRRRGRILQPVGVVCPSDESCAWFVTLGPGRSEHPLLRAGSASSLGRALSLSSACVRRSRRVLVRSLAVLAMAFALHFCHHRTGPASSWVGRRIHPDGVHTELLAFRRGLLADWVAAGLEGGAWLPEVVPGGEHATTLFPCPMRRLGPRRQGYRVSYQRAGAHRRAFWWRRRFTRSHYSPVWAALRVGHGLDGAKPLDRRRLGSEPHLSLVRWRRSLGSAPAAALEAAAACWAGSCHCCGGGGNLPVGHLHIHLLAWGPRFAFTSGQLGQTVAGHRLRDVGGFGLHEFFRLHGYANVNLKRIDGRDIDVVRAYISKVSKYAAKCVEQGASPELIGGLEPHQGAAYYQGAYLRLYGRSIRCGGSVGICYGVRAARRDASLVVHGCPAPSEVASLDGVAASIVVWGDGCEPASACLPVLGGQGHPSGIPPILGNGHNFPRAALVPPRRLPRQASGGSVGRWVGSLAYLRGGRLVVGARAKCRVALGHSRSAWRSAWACQHRAGLGGPSAGWWAVRSGLFMGRCQDWLLAAGEWALAADYWGEHDGLAYVVGPSGVPRPGYQCTSLHVLAGRICDIQDSGVCGYSVVQNTECRDTANPGVECPDIASSACRLSR